MPTAQEEVEMNKLIEKLQQTGNVLKRKYEAEKQRMKELHALQRQGWNRHGRGSRNRPHVRPRENNFDQFR